MLYIKWLKTSSLQSMRREAALPKPVCTDLASRDPGLSNVRAGGLGAHLAPPKHSGMTRDLKSTFPIPFLFWVNPHHDGLSLFKVQGNLVQDLSMVAFLCSKTCPGSPNRQHGVPTPLPKRSLTTWPIEWFYVAPSSELL